ncbi:AAA family ATPase [Acinetobacter pittii]|uniref:AAA family ATPase n=1 Tax=Acinetobacter pittii TaxID=48296 RepID=UPI001F286EBE|nr:AAA family ATPase [Acinetobacter pittii]MCE6236886.1 AAA family ATPase [Acinetobacter pittii]MCE6692113.1 AAA family ATPase [Acinetobacter pittii]MCE6699220.1 AAA family ATPase [Acinetobacter pittii]
MKYLQSITGSLKGLPVQIDIPLKGQNLIITGKNGVGKTFFLNQINNTISKELLSKLNNLSEESSYVKRKFFRSLEKVLEHYPSFLPLIDSSNLKKVRQLVTKRDLTEEQNNEFYIRSKELIHEIYAINKSIYDNESYNYSYKTLFESKYELNELNHQDSRLNKRITIETEELLYNLEKISHILNNFDKFTTLGSDLKVIIENIEDLNRNVKSSKVTFNYFTAFRQTQITHSTNTTSLDDYINHAKSAYENTLGQLFEQYLVNIKIDRSLALTESKNIELVHKIDNWFDKLNEDLKFLFEDNSTYLDFDMKTKKFSINQNSKKFSFQTLSSGYSSIFAIYTELMLRSQFLNILPDELNGIVLIDEIDAHLHISLQRKILPFFIKSFPNIQFIVTTHSPFVITSSNQDTVIFDLTNGSFIQDDLSQYSYESIIKGLFHVNPMSLETKKSVEELKNLLNESPTNFSYIRSIIEDLIPLEKNDQLDRNVKNLYLQAINLLIDNNELENLDV